MAMSRSPRSRPVRSARIADVAKIAGVSSATVSRALANIDVVTEETRRKVLEAVRSTGYTPNIAARNLRKQETKMALVVVPDIANPFFAEVLRGVDATLSAAGYGLIIANLDNSREKEARYVDLAFARQVDGVLLLCGHVPAGSHRTLAQANLPIVAACEIIPGADFPQVEVNNCEASEAAVAHLISLGHRRIGYISGPPANILDVERRRGYKAALFAAGVKEDASLIFTGDFTFRGGAEAAGQVLAMPKKRQPTAVFAANDEMAIGFLKTVHAAGRKIPEEFSIVGFDAIEYADYCEPTLTTVIQPRRDLGARAADLLIDMMREHKLSSRVNVRLEATLLIRNSTAPASKG
ncbi:LacI family DNA-binding transcriptional regulator [Terrarubrum flagellatum]|uniref:LacI family DNA-binding transcriptional regulator n=1 Tax=Terrirubrum flagellatum TaxID=2895980 RepID=UPI003144D42A